MNRLAGIIIAVIGLLIALLSFLKIIPKLTWTGAALVFLGILMVGLSFIRKPEPEDTPRMSTPGTLLNMFFSPTEVFQNLRRHPRWLVAILIMSILSTLYFNLFLFRLTPERVTNFAIDKTLEMPMVASREDARKQIEAGRAAALEENKNPVLRTGQAVNSFVKQVFVYAFLGAVFFLFAVAMGGKINYWQAFSAAVYAYFPVMIVWFVLNTIILFIKDPVDIHPVLGQGSLVHDNLGFLFTPSTNPVLFSVVSAFSLLAFYWIWLNVTGLKNAGEKISPTIAWVATLAIFFLGILFAALVSWMFVAFIS